MSRTCASLTAAALLLSALGAQAAQAPKDKPPAPSIPVQRANLDPLPTVTDQVNGLKIIITQVNYPGVPDRSSCRFVVRTVNQSHDRVATYALLRTFSGEKEALNSWMVPTGELAPGETSERLYSCKTASYLKVDRESISGWPGRCEINGQERTPCPLTVGLEANLNLIAKD